jgi:hypothetical protein
MPPRRRNGNIWGGNRMAACGILFTRSMCQLLVEQGHWMSYRPGMKVAAILFLALTLPSCGSYYSDLKIINGGKDQVSDLSLGDRRTIWKLGDLDPGARVAFRGHLQGEGGPIIAWSSMGKRHSEEGCYYTGGMPARGSIIIVGEHLEFRCK